MFIVHDFESSPGVQLYSGSVHVDHDMYLVLANFMVYKPALDLQEVPLFYLLVHSSSNQVSVYFTVLGY